MQQIDICISRHQVNNPTMKDSDYKKQGMSKCYGKSYLEFHNKRAKAKKVIINGKAMLYRQKISFQKTLEKHEFKLLKSCIKDIEVMDFGFEDEEDENQQEPIIDVYMKDNLNIDEVMYLAKKHIYKCAQLKRLDPFQYDFSFYFHNESQKDFHIGM